MLKTGKNCHPHGGLSFPGKARHDGVKKTGGQSFHEPCEKNHAFGKSDMRFVTVDTTGNDGSGSISGYDKRHGMFIFFDKWCADKTR